ADFLQHLVETERVVKGIEDADQQLARRVSTRALPGAGLGSRSRTASRRSRQCGERFRRSQGGRHQTACSSEKFAAIGTPVRVVTHGSAPKALFRRRYPQRLYHYDSGGGGQPGKSRRKVLPMYCRSLMPISLVKKPSQVILRSRAK